MDRQDKIAIIGGTGVYDPQILEDLREVAADTPYGRIQALEGSFAKRDVVFMNRHGAGHSVPPHKVNYRAIIWGLRALGVKRIIATTAVGSVNPAMQPGHFVFPDQFIEFTKSRVSTFFDGGEAGVVHTDMTEPYCPSLRRTLSAAAESLELTYHNGGTYVACEGPRFETPAEIRMYARLGGDLVGMTSFPEVALAHELGLCYATVSMVTNMAAGISKTKLTHEEVLTTMAENSRHFKELLLTAVPRLDEDHDCACAAVATPL